MLNFSKSMEVTYHGKRAQYLWHLMLNSLSLLIVNCVAGLAGIGMQQEDGSKIPGLPFLAQPLLYAIVWIWARQNPTTQMSVFGFFSVKAVYYPWFLLAYHCVMGGGLNIFYLMGFVVGHIFHFLHALHPQTKGEPAPARCQVSAQAIGRRRRRRSPPSPTQLSAALSESCGRLGPYPALPFSVLSPLRPPRWIATALAPLRHVPQTLGPLLSRASSSSPEFLLVPHPVRT